MSAPGYQLPTNLYRDPTSVVGARCLAWVVDVLLYLALMLVFIPPLSPLAEKADVPEGMGFEEACSDRLTEVEDARICMLLGDTAYWTDDADAVIQALVSLAWFFLVFGLLQGIKGFTPGKALLGLRVVREDGQLPGIGPALLRTLLWVVDGLFCYLVGLILILSTTGHRRLGDMAANTYVVAKADAGRPVRLPGAGPMAPTAPGYGAPPGYATTRQAPAWGAPPPPGPAAPTPGQPGGPGSGPTWPPSAPPTVPTPAATPPTDAANWGTWGQPTQPQASPPATPPADPETGSPDPGTPPADTAFGVGGQSPTAGSPTSPGGDEPPDEPPAESAPAEPESSPTPAPGAEGPPSEAPSEPPGTPTGGPDDTSSAPADKPSAEAAAEESGGRDVPASGGTAGTTGPGAAPTYQPQWDAARGTYIQWDPNRNHWLQWDDTAKEWKAL